MIWIGLFLVIMVAGALYRVENSAEDKLKTWATNKGYKVISFELVSHAFKTRSGCVPGVAMAVLHRHDLNEPVSGRIQWERGYFDIEFIEFIPDQTMTRADRRALASEEEVVEDRLATLYIEDDHEAKVLSEVNRRLDGITSQANWMEPYDLDGSGHIDEEEWSILRGNVMAQVLAELGDEGVRQVSAPANTSENIGKRLDSNDPDDVLW